MAIIVVKIEVPDNQVTRGEAAFGSREAIQASLAQHYKQTVALYEADKARQAAIDNNNSLRQDENVARDTAYQKAMDEIIVT